MDEPTRALLDDVNRRFYRDRAGDFDAHRRAPWPGWSRVIALAPRPRPGRALRLLDVGCGNGRLAALLRSEGPRPARYLGVDGSAPLLALARTRLGDGDGLVCGWQRCDWASRPPEHALPAGPFDWIFLFGVLHHLAGHERRRALLTALAARLAPGGRLALSRWRFADEARFLRRRLPWSRAGLGGDAALQVEPGDVLLRFGRDGDAARYCHDVDDREWEALAQGLGLLERARFDDDGRDRRSNRYHVLERPEAAA